MQTNSDLKLTSFSKGSGCGCKIAPAVLQKIIPHQSEQFKQLLGGYETNDDAAIWKLNEETLLLSTTDFFTPVVDNPFDFGRVAAANALSDIYAMGGKPAFALAVLGFPVDKLPVEVAAEIMLGAKKTCEEAGIPIAGGHSIDNPEPVFGLVVNGMVHPQHLKKNSGAKPGDLLFITKPIGSGIISAAVKRGKADPSHAQAALEVMCKLNLPGIEFGELEAIHAMTDVTGFGLIGHLIEMCNGSSTSAILYNDSIPLIEGAEQYISQFIFPDNTYRNWNAYEKHVKGINGPEFISLCDPQTSGGLLIAVDPTAIKELEVIFKQSDISSFLKPIGRVTGKMEYVIEVVASES